MRSCQMPLGCELPAEVVPLITTLLPENPVKSVNQSQHGHTSGQLPGLATRFTVYITFLFTILEWKRLATVDAGSFFFGFFFFYLLVSAVLFILPLPLPQRINGFTW